jgi:predicted dehydrogenase
LTGPPRVGVVGAGALGYHHIRLLKALPLVRFTGFVDADPARAAWVARELDVTPYASLDALLGDVDAVTVVVPTSAHYAVAAAAIARGRHVFIEKPITTTVEEADALLAAARTAGALIQSGHIERFNRAVRAALPLVANPRFIESDRLAPFTPRGADVAVVLDLMIHDIDLVRIFVQQHVTEVAAIGVPLLTPSADIANARLVFTGGAVANITASRVSRERVRKLRIFQPNGYFSLDLAAGTGEHYRLRDDIDLAQLATGPLSIDAFVARIPLSAPDDEPLRLELDSFVAAVRGEQPVSVTGEDGREALEIALRILSVMAG